MRQASSRPPQQAVERLLHLHTFGNIQYHTVLRKRCRQGGKLAFLRANQFTRHASNQFGIFHQGSAQIGKNDLLADQFRVKRDA